MGLVIKKISYYLPKKVVTNESLKRQFPSWNMQKIEEKSGVFRRYIAKKNETAFDLACKAIDLLIEDSSFDIEEIQGIIFCTQSPDYIMPSNAFLVHEKYAFSKNVWAFDYNLACSGYIYGLTIARGLLETKMAKNILLINADTYSKYINKKDRSTSILFSDAAAVSILTLEEKKGIIDIELASEGKDFKSFYIPAGGLRFPKNSFTRKVTIDSSGNEKSLNDIQMNGFGVWDFITKNIPSQIIELLKRNKYSVDDIDLFIFHQASKLTLDSLIKKMKINPNKVFLNLDKIGNTVSASIPIALKDAENSKILKRGDLILISGFGVGLSWGTAIIKY